MVAETVSPLLIPVTSNSKLVPSFGATSVGPEVIVPVVVPEIFISLESKELDTIGSLNKTLNVAELFEVGSACVDFCLTIVFIVVAAKTFEAKNKQKIIKLATIYFLNIDLILFFCM